MLSTAATVNSDCILPKIRYLVLNTLVSINTVQFVRERVIVWLKECNSVWYIVSELDYTP